MTGDNPVNYVDPVGWDKAKPMDAAIWQELSRRHAEEGGVQYYSPGQGSYKHSTRDDLQNMGKVGLETIWNQHKTAIQSAADAGDWTAVRSLTQQGTTVREVMAEKGYQPLGAHGEPGYEPMSFGEQVWEFGWQSAKMAYIPGWISNPEEYNPLLVGRKYGQMENNWEYTAQKVALGTAVVATALAGGVMAYQALAGWLAGGTTASAQGGAATAVLGESGGTTTVVLSQAAREGILVGATKDAYLAAIGRLTPALLKVWSTAGLGAYGGAHPDSAYYGQRILNVIEAAARAAAGLLPM